jgi:methylenetetrahydrofolate dehydrogenase (NADP+)/methenyltetrahydrofolate cyclohydrolase
MTFRAMKLLDGKKIAEEKLEMLKTRVAQLPHAPSLAVILVGDDPASHLYVKLKEKAAKKIGIDFHKYLLAADEPAEKVLETVAFLREDNEVDAILVQMPLPEDADPDAVIEAMGVEKDVDGFHPEHISQFIDGKDVMWPVFPQALVRLAEASGKDLDGKSAVIVGKSDLFTQAMVAACTRVGLRVMQVPCEKLACMQAAVLAADVVFTACGKAGVITGDYSKDGAIVIDGGIATVDGETVGDCDVESVSEKAAFLTPVPGGVGPVTIACLLENVVDLAVARRL